MLDYEIVESVFFILILGLLGTLGISLIWRGLVDLLSEQSSIRWIIPNLKERKNTPNRFISK
jgi:hypothetical protein